MVAESREILNSLLHFYDENGDLKESLKFWNILLRNGKVDVISYASIIKAMIKNQKFEDALVIYSSFSSEKDDILLNLGLNICSEIKNDKFLSKGFDIFYEITQNEKRENFLKNSQIISSLIYFLGNAGAMSILDNLKRELRFNWKESTEVFNAYIGAYAKNGFGKLALEIFGKSAKEKRDGITYLNAILACAHVGDASRSLHIFNEMESKDIWVDHVTCVVDNLGKIGKIEEALDFIKKYEGFGKVNSVTWKTLLSACKKHGNERIAQITENSISNLLEFDV